MPLLSTIGAIGKQLLQGLPIVGGLIQGNINAKIARENTDKTIAANRELAKYQYDRDLEMWEKGNIYNSPLAQMDRLKAAGLNPNMVYGSGSAAGMSAGTLPKFNAPTQSYNYIPPVDIPQIIGMFQDFQLKNAQMRNMDQALQLGDVKWSILRNQEVEGKSKIEIAKMNELLRRQDFEQKGQLFPSQLDFAKGKLRTQSLEQDRLIEATRNLNLNNEYYAAKAITGLFGGAVGAIGKGLSWLGLGSRAGKAAGALNTGTLRDAKKWQEFERAQRRSWNR